MYRKLLPLFLLLLLLTGCAAASFDGCKVVDENGFTLTYTTLNQSQSATLSLAAGDTLQVALAHTAGTVDVLVEAYGQEPIYRGSGLQDASFALNIAASGDYSITVSGHGACGSSVFMLEHGEER